MSIQPPQGILNIPNATLRVGKLVVNESVGTDTALNTIARNTILLVDGEEYTANKNWALKLPNAWVGEFECNTASAGNFSEFNFYNEGASSNAQGYNLTFNDTTVELRYDGTLLTSGTLASTVTGTGVKKVRLMFERTILSVTVDGTLVFTHDDTSGPRPRVYSTTTGGFLNFFTDGGVLKNLKIVNEKWISDGTSNIAYVGGGEVAIGKAFAFNRVSNVSQIKVDSNVVTEYTGPHGRGVAPLKKYPEIAFDDTSKMDMGEGGTTNRLLFKQAGYTITASSTHPTNDRVPYRAFNGDHATGWICASGSWNASTNVYQGGRGIGDYDGEWIKLELPNKIKVETMYIEADLNSGRRPLTGKLLGSNDDSTWVIIKDLTSIPNQDRNTLNIGSTVAYKYIAFLTETIPNGNDTVWIDEIEYYGYEEDPPAGDTSIDTTFTSVMNTPQTTGANVYVDAKLSTDFTNQVTGPTPVGTAATHNDTGKYWELTGELTSNVTVEANTFLQGDAPHSVSVWFNSSNLEANVSNTCVFSIASEEKLDSVNLDLQSNTWHNLTYAYQGEGGSRVTYLDGRKVSEDQAEDTFGEYPPFAMTGYSQGGYVVSATAESNDGSYNSYEAFNGVINDNTALDAWQPNYNTGGDFDTSGNATTQTQFNPGGGASLVNGPALLIQFPHRVKITSYDVYARRSNDVTYVYANKPKSGRIYGSNDGLTWTQIDSFGDWTTWVANKPQTEVITTPGAYNRYAMVVESMIYQSQTWVAIGEWKLYGHRENDLVRLPDPTRVLKYPHVAMTGGSPTALGVSDLTHAQRGYIVTASSMYVDNPSNPYQPWHAFDGLIGSQGTYGTFWNSTGLANTYGGGSGAYGTVRTANLGLDSGGASTPQGGTRENGEWLKIQLPHKIVLSHIQLVGHSDTSAQPKSFRLYGSDNGTTWVEVLTVNNTSTLDTSVGTTFTPGSTPDAYNYFGLVVTATQSRTNYLIVSELELYGTEEATPVPIQIGGGNIDKVANFRVYDKFIDQNQALEIWDAQKDEFGRAKSSMTLHKGRLGIGTTEPEGRLAVADEPDPDAYGLQEYPPKPLAGYKTHIEGHGEFCVKVSSNNANFEGWKAFNKIFTGGEGWMSEDNPDTYTQGTGLPNSTTAVFNGKQGEWLHIELPYKIRLKKTTILQRTSSDHPRPTGSFTIWGSNDTVNWDEIITGTHTRTVAVNETTGDPINRDIDTSKFYSSYVFQVHSIIVTSGNEDMGHVAEWKLFGYREQVTKQSVLHDGQLTLTKNLDVPRIGPPLDADDTPRRDRLVVEYNTSTNPTFEGAVRDTSGRGNDGVFYGGASYDATKKAFEFDGTDDYVVSGYLGIPTGAFVHSVSLWFKRDSIGSNMFLSTIGGESDATNARFSMMLQDSPDEGNIHLSISGSNSYFSSGITTGDWFHVVYTYNGGAQGSASTAHTVYVNGVKKAISGGTGSGTLNLPENSRVALGSHPWGGSNYLDGSISNFKLYDKILTAQEVKTLYDMGRCDEGHHVVNFSKTRVGIGLGDGEAPTYTLDVRGQIRSQDSLVTSFTGQHRCFPDEPVEKGLIVSAKKNRFVKLNGFATGQEAITIDESLPIVSLSNVAEDKACFGVVSSIEKPTPKRIQITNGIISDSKKERGDNRAIVNSVGEGAIWVVNTGGPLESGDYITTSSVKGYGQYQSSQYLTNFTVAKITMDCDFTGSNVAVQTIKREETGLRTITEDVWNTLVDYDRSSNTETQYSNTLVPSAYSGQSGYVPREVTTIVDYTDGSNLISIAEWSNLESNIQNTYQSNTFTEIADYTKFISLDEWSNLTVDVQNTYSEAEITTYYQIKRGENVLDENGQLQFEDKTGATEAPYERRFLDASGAQTDEANAVHIAAFVGCTYHCG
jgi:hypothetical protein